MDKIWTQNFCAYGDHQTAYVSLWRRAMLRVTRTDGVQAKVVIRLLHSLYKETTSFEELDRVQRKWFKQNTVLRQGCVKLHCLFFFYGKIKARIVTEIPAEGVTVGKLILTDSNSPEMWQRLAFCWWRSRKLLRHLILISVSRNVKHWLIE